MEITRKQFELIAPFNTGSAELNITVSIGAAALKPGLSAATVVTQAGDALNVAKDNGRNRVEWGAS